MLLSSIDIRTVLDLLVVGSLGTVLTILVYRRPLEAERPLRLYMLGALAHAPAWFLLGLRGIVPDLFSIYLGNILVISGFGLGALALASVDSPGRRPDALFAALAAAGIAVVLVFAESPNGRMAASSFAVMLPFLALSVIMFARARRSPLRGAIALATAIYAAIHLWRAIYAISAGSGFSLMSPAAVQTIAFFPLILFQVAGTLGLILMLKQASDDALRDSEEKYRTLVEKASEGIVIVRDGRLAFANGRILEMTGMQGASLAGRAIGDFIWPDDRAMVAERHRARVEGAPAPDAYDFRIVGPSGQPFWVSASAARIAWKGRPASLMILTDIDGRRKSEEEVARLLAEKEMLLKEVHHRVKNNLAVAASLLDIQAAEASGKDPEAVLRDARARLGTLARLYELLHVTGGFDQAAVRPFLDSLIADLREVFPEAASVRFELDADDFSLEVRRLSSLGLLINEIVTNSMKHAFAKADEPTIRLTARLAQGRVRITCSDNGSGLEPEAGEGNDEGLGSRLIEMLAEQIGAELRKSVEGGYSYEIEFRLEGQRP
jgi:PAS domain S-box-containing protein